jgi:hypothetical protein
LSGSAGARRVGQRPRASAKQIPDTHNPLVHGCPNSTKINSEQRKEIRSAWHAARSAWRHTETSVAALMHANMSLLQTLGTTGADMARQTRRDLGVALKTLEKNGRSAKRQFEKAMRPHVAAPARARKATVPARKAVRAATAR